MGFPNPCTRWATDLDSFLGYWRYRNFVIIIIIESNYWIITRMAHHIDRRGVTCIRTVVPTRQRPGSVLTPSTGNAAPDNLRSLPVCVCVEVTLSRRVNCSVPINHGKELVVLTSDSASWPESHVIGNRGWPHRILDIWGRALFRGFY